MKKVSKAKSILWFKAGKNLYRRGGRHGIYYARFEKSGKETWKSLRTTSPSIAKAKLAELEAKVTKSNVTRPDGKAPSLAQAIKEALQRWKLRRAYKSLETMEFRLKRIADSPIGRLPINRVAAEQIERVLLSLIDVRYKDQIDENGEPRLISNSSRNRIVVELRKVFREFKEWRLDNPCDEIQRYPERDGERVAPTLEEVNSVLEVLRDSRTRAEGQKAADFVEFLLFSGCRLAEANGLVWERVFFDRNYLIVHGKSDQDSTYKARQVPLFTSLRQLMERLRRENPEATGPVFPGTGDQAYNPRRILSTANEKAELPKERHFSFHGLRHTFATECVIRGIHFSTIAQILGHEDNGILVAQRYGNHLKNDHMMAFVDVLDFSKEANQANTDFVGDILNALEHAPDPKQQLGIFISKSTDIVGMKADLNDLKDWRELSQKVDGDLTAMFLAKQNY